MNHDTEGHLSQFKSKLENPVRVAELAPEATLKEIGLSDNKTFCDMGAGTGIFSFCAAEMTNARVYAVDTSVVAREYLASKQVPNISVQANSREVPDNSCDMVLLCTVLHEVSDVPEMVRELGRIIKNEGTLAVIEFHKQVTPMGPPVSHRLSESDVSAAVSEYFSQTSRFVLGDNFYCLCFGKTV